MRDGARSITPRELEIATNSVCEADKDWVCPPQGPGYRCDGREISGIEYPLLLGTDSMVEDCARLCENLLQCDGFEYIGPGHSDHGKCWLKQTVSYVRQSRGSRNEHRYSSKCRIAPKQLPVFRHNLGFCRGGPAWSSSSDLWNCLEHSLTVDGCKAACNDDSNCGAFDIPPGGGSGNNGCCLFRAGNTGNGGQGRNCYVQQPLATRVGNGWVLMPRIIITLLDMPVARSPNPSLVRKSALGRRNSHRPYAVIFGELTCVIASWTM